MKLNKVGFFGLAISLSFTLVACGPAPNPVTQPSATIPTSNPDPIPTAPPLPSDSPDSQTPVPGQPTPSPTASSGSGNSGSGAAPSSSPQVPSEAPGNEALATAIRLYSPGTVLNSGNTFQLTAEVLKGLEKLSNIGLEWTSSNPNLIQVDSNGKVTALSSSGSSVITARVPNTEISASITLELRSSGSGGGGGGGAVNPGPTQPTPVITALSPDPIEPGQTLTITGTGFIDSTTVTIASLPATITARTPTSLDVTVPAATPKGSASVTVTNTASVSQSVTINVPLKITSFSPTQGVSGTQVVLTGQSFTGATAVTFNGTSASFTVDSDTQITATLPFGAVTDGKINVVIPTDNADSTTDFDVTGRIFLVRQAATGTNTGASWTHAKTSLYDALNDSQSGDEIWVAAGTYKPLTAAETTSSNRSRTFQLKAGVSLYGDFAGTETTRAQRVLPSTHVSILSGDLDANDTYNPAGNPAGSIPGGDNNAYHVVTGAAGANDATRPVLDSFMIQGGNASGAAAQNQNQGGGMFNNNLGTNGPRLSNLTFRYNRAGKLSAPGAVNGYGGALANVTSNLQLSDVIFTLNGTQGPENGGGAVYESGGQSTYQKVVFDNNYGQTDGGGAFLRNGNTSIFSQVAFENNAANDGGGGASVRNAAPTFVNTVFYNNLGTIYGGGLYLDEAAIPKLVNVTIVNNTAGDSLGAGIHQESNPAQAIPIVNSLIYSNSIQNVALLLNQGNIYQQIASVNDPFTFRSGPKGCDGKWFTADDGLRLITNSIAKDTGIIAPGGGVVVPGVDMLGNARPQGAGIDSGAYEGEFTPGFGCPPV